MLLVNKSLSLVPEGPVSIFNSVMANFAWFPEIIYASGNFSLLFSTQLCELWDLGVRVRGFRLCRLQKVPVQSSKLFLWLSCQERPATAMLCQHCRVETRAMALHYSKDSCCSKNNFCNCSYSNITDFYCTCLEEQSQVQACPCRWMSSHTSPCIASRDSDVLPVRSLNYIFSHQFLSQKIKGVSYSMCLDAVIDAKAQ